MVTSIIERLDGLWEAVPTFNNLLLGVTKQEECKWIEVGSKIDPEDVELFSSKDGVHLSNDGVAILFVMLDQLIKDSTVKKPTGRYPGWLILPQRPLGMTKRRKKRGKGKSLVLLCGRIYFLSRFFLNCCCRNKNSFEKINYS